MDSASDTSCRLKMVRSEDVGGCPDGVLVAACTATSPADILCRLSTLTRRARLTADLITSRWQLYCPVTQRLNPVCSPGQPLGLSMKELSGSGGTHSGSRWKNLFLTVNGCSSLTRGSGPYHRDTVTPPRKGVPGSSVTYRKERGGRTLGPTAPLSQGIHGSLTYVAIGSLTALHVSPSQGNGVPK